MKITQKYLKSILDYNPETGKFYWKTRSDVRPEWNTKFSGKETGKWGDRYHVLAINNRKYYCHRLAWLYVYGEFPFEIDHINLDPFDNRISNLRSVTKAQNQRHKKLQRNNKSGYKGVCFNKNNKTWQAGIKVNKKNIALGQFGCPTAAHFAYCRAAKKYHGEFARTE